MRKYPFIILFVFGLAIFSYPTISNMFATKAHRTTIEQYRETVHHIDEHKLQIEKEKVQKHNEELAQSDLNFVDPFADSPSNETEGTKSYYDALNIGPAIGSIEIPKINVELPIYHGTTDDVLSKGAGHLENSSLPSSELGTHSVITAHRGLPSSKLFRHLDKLSIGDQFYVEVLDEIIAYEVRSINIVLPTETDWLTIDENENKITLLTCDPYMINTHRMLVTGHRIPYNPDEKEQQQKEYTNYYFIIVVTALLIVGFYLILRHKKNKVINNEKQ